MSSRSGRRSREETAELIREAAVGLLQRDGLQGFSNSVRLDDALNLLVENDGIRLTHGSIYGRIWADQRDFQLDVVATTVSRYDGSDIAEAIVAAVPAGRAPGDQAASQDVARDDLPLATMFEAAVKAARASRQWNLWLGANAAVVTTPSDEDDERLGGALARAQKQVVSSLARALETVTGRPCATEPGGAAQVLLTQLVGVSVTQDASAATAVLAEAIGSS